MKSAFSEVFIFLTNLAWKSRLTIPILVTTAFLIMDIRLQIEINIQSGQVAAADLNRLPNDEEYENFEDDEEFEYEEYTTDSSSGADEEEDDVNVGSW